MRLYFHPESDSLFWDEWATDPLCEDVTDEPKFRKAALARGINEPEVVSVVLLHEKNIVPDAVAKGVANAIIKSYKVWERKPADLYPTPVLSLIHI